MTTCLEIAVHSVFCACLSWAFVKFCVCPSIPFGIEGRMWVLIVLIPDHCLSISRSGNILSFLLPLFQEGQLSVTGESMCTKYWLTAWEV